MTYWVIFSIVLTLGFAVFLWRYLNGVEKCRHNQWKKTFHFTSPPNRAFELKWADQTLINRLMFGQTTIKQECSECGLVKTNTVVGRVTE